MQEVFILQLQKNQQLQEIFELKEANKELSEKCTQFETDLQLQNN